MTAHEFVSGGAYVNLVEDTRLRYRVDPDGDSLEIIMLGPMELSIGMTPSMLRRCQEMLAEAQNAVTQVRQRDAVSEA